MDNQEIERDHFDRIAASSLAPDADLSMARYFNRYAHPPQPPLFTQEYLFHIAGDVKGKQVLDYCCGEGEITVLMAMKGAKVWAFDLSPNSVEVTRRRAEINGVLDRVTLTVCKAGADPFPDQFFDLVIGQGALHHLLPLTPIGQHVRQKLKPTGKAIFVEPLAASRFLRFARTFFPPCPIATPGERPLQWQDIEDFSKSFSHMELVFFELLSRGWRWSWGSTMLRLVDWHCLQLLPFTRRFAGCVVIEGMCKK